MMTSHCPLAAGDDVRWTPDNDLGAVARVLPGQAVAITWKGLGQTEWYPIPCVSLEYIEPVTAGAGGKNAL